MSASTTEAHLHIAAAGELLSAAASPFWTKHAPRLLAKHYRAVDDAGGWRTWRKHLASRDKPGRVDRLFPGRKSPLVWALPVDARDPACGELIQRLTDLPKRAASDQSCESWNREAEKWLQGAEQSKDARSTALESLAWAHALPRLAAHLSAPVWWKLLDRLIAVGSQTESTDLAADPLAHQLCHGELPLTLSHQLPEIGACRSLRIAASQALDRGLADVLDGEGLPQARYYEIFRPLLACWTRARAVGGKSTWDPESETQFRLVVQEALRLSRGDGSQVLLGATEHRWPARLFKLAVELSDRPNLRRLSRTLFPGPGKPARDKASIDIPAAVHSEWSEIAVLAPSWHRGGPKLTLLYHDRQTRLELEMRGEQVWSGVWELNLKLNDQPVEVTGSWEEVCWVSDPDVDYVEIEARLSGGLRVQRQICLGRKDRCLLLADAVLGEPGGRISYESKLPLGASIKVEPAAETREVGLVGRRARVTALPLALAEWRADPRRGELQTQDQRLALQQSGVERLFAPLLFDLDPKRSARGVTWRNLTVAESRVVLPATAAAGFRAQSGKSQWLVYRSLAPVGVRTVLGQNLASEFLFGEFQRSGEVEKLIEIE